MGRQRERRKQRQQQQRQQQQPRRGQPAGGFDRWTIIAGIAVVVVVIAVLGYLGLAQGKGNGSPAAGGTSTPGAVGKPVDGIQCGSTEMLNYHIHQHLTLYDHGKQVPVPALIGIPGSQSGAPCYYWIHVHPGDPGIIHIESPLSKTFHLGNFFDIWKATAAYTVPPGDAYVTKLQQAASRGQVVAFLDGKRWHGDYRSIPLKSHAVITIEIAPPAVPPKPFTNWQGQ